MTKAWHAPPPQPQGSVVSGYEKPQAKIHKSSACRSASRGFDCLPSHPQVLGSLSTMQISAATRSARSSCTVAGICYMRAHDSNRPAHVTPSNVWPEKPCHRSLMQSISSISGKSPGNSILNRGFRRFGFSAWPRTGNPDAGHRANSGSQRLHGTALINQAAVVAFSS